MFWALKMCLYTPVGDREIHVRIKDVSQYRYICFMKSTVAIQKHRYSKYPSPIYVGTEDICIYVILGVVGNSKSAGRYL